MDASIRLRRLGEAPSDHPPRKILSLPTRPAGANAFAMRKAILECAEAAAVAEPTNTDMRALSFLARLSARMESLGEPELDRALWHLTETKIEIPTGA